MATADTIIGNIQASAELASQTAAIAIADGMHFADGIGDGWSGDGLEFGEIGDLTKAIVLDGDPAFDGEYTPPEKTLQKPSFLSVPIPGTITLPSPPGKAPTGLFAGGAPSGSVAPFSGQRPAYQSLPSVADPSFPAAPPALDTTNLFTGTKPDGSVAPFAEPAPVFATVPEIGSPTLPAAPEALDRGGLFTQAKPVFDVDPFNAGSVDFVRPEVPVAPDMPTPPPALDTAALFTTPKPAWDLTPFSQAAPEINTHYALPAKPDVLYPDAPLVRDAALPTLPQLSLPEAPDAQMNAVEPVAGDIAGEYQRVFERATPEFKAYVMDGVQEWISRFAPNFDTLMATLDGKIAAYMEAGQILPNGVEQQIFDRARQRVLAETENLRQEVTRQTAKRGFMLPPGSMVSALQQVQTQASDRVGAAAAETAIERAKIEVQHWQFTQQMLIQLRTSLLPVAVSAGQLLVQTNALALDYAKGAAQFMLEMFNAGVELYRAKASVYQIYAQVYEIAVKSELAKLDIYRVELEAAKTGIEIDQTRVQLYGALIEAQNKKVEVYSAEMRAIEIQANLEKVKLELFREQVQAHAVLVQSKEGEFNAYRASIAGDSARVDAHVAEINAYSNEVQAAKVKVDAASAITQASTLINENLIKRLEFDLAAYKTQLESKQAEADIFKALVQSDVAEVEAYGKEVDAYRAGVEAEKSVAEIDVSRAEAVIAANKSLADNYSTMVEAYKALTGAKQIEADIYKALIAGDAARVEAFSAQVSAYTAQIGAEKTRVDAGLGRLEAVTAYNDGLTKQYLGDVEAYKGLTQAKGVEADIFKALVAADTARVQAFGEEVRAYAAQVDASKAQADAALAVTQATAGYNKSLTDQYVAEVEAYKAEVQAEATRFSGHVDKFKALIQAYLGRVDAQKTDVMAEVSARQLDLEKARSEYDGKVKLKMAEIDVIKAKADAGSQIRATGASAHASIAGSALSGINGIASVMAQE